MLSNVGAVPRLPESKSLLSGAAWVLVFSVLVLPLIKSRGGWWQGACLVLLAVFELIQINSITYRYAIQPDVPVSAGPGYGLFITMAGGALAAFCGFLFHQQSAITAPNTAK